MPSRHSQGQWVVLAVGNFVVMTAKDGSVYFRLVASNGETILSSEIYKSKSSALNGIESVRKNATDARYERKKTTKGQPMFNLKAANHQAIGASESYSSDSAMESGIASIKKNAPTATVDDQTS